MPRAVELTLLAIAGIAGLLLGIFLAAIMWHLRSWRRWSLPAIMILPALATMAMLIGAPAATRLSTPGVGFLLIDADGHRHTHDPEQLLHTPATGLATPPASAPALPAASLPSTTSSTPS